MQSTLLFHPLAPTSSNPDPAFAHIPQISSPLTPTTPKKPSTPITDTQSRRRSQYKSRPITSPVTPRGRQSEPRRHRPKVLKPLNFGHRNDSAVPSEETPRTAFLRERLKARCIERARQDREEKLNRKRAMSSSEPSSDGFDSAMDFEDEEEDEDEDAVFNDELFKRIMSTMHHKRQHQYRLSYAWEVGSSFDPDMEDVAEWEDELRGAGHLGVDVEDMEQEELAAYADEYDLHLDDLPVNDIFSLSDLEDYPPGDADGTPEDVEMDI